MPENRKCQKLAGCCQKEKKPTERTSNGQSWNNLTTKYKVALDYKYKTNVCEFMLIWISGWIINTSKETNLSCRRIPDKLLRYSTLNEKKY